MTRGQSEAYGLRPVGCRVLALQGRANLLLAKPHNQILNCQLLDQHAMDVCSVATAPGGVLGRLRRVTQPSLAKVTTFRRPLTTAAAECPAERRLFLTPVIRRSAFPC